MRHKVLLFIPHLQQGGAERQILELMNRLPARYEPSLCLYDAREAAHYQQYGEPTHLLGVPEMGPVGLARLVALLRRERPTILHSYRDKANLWARLASFAAPVPIVLTSVRNRYQGPLYMTAEFLLQRRSARILTNSRGIEDELVSWSRVEPERIQVINNFIDLDRFRPPSAEERAAARIRYGIDEREVALLLPGRIAMQKHQVGLGLALAYLRRAGRLADRVKLILAGRRRDKLYSRVVPVWMRAIGVDDRVTYLEPVKDMLGLYHAADALVMPSLFEGMPNAVLEAHACGLPAIVSYAANRDDIVVDGVTGAQVATLDHRGLADAIAAMVGAPAAARRAMGARGRAHVAEKFHPDRIRDEMVALYDSLIAQRGLA